MANSVGTTAGLSLDITSASISSPFPFPQDHLHDSLLVNVASANPPETSLELDPTGDAQHTQEPEFMYAQILKDILLKMPLTDENKTEMFQFFERKNFNNGTQLPYVELFKKDCSPKTAAHWYSRDTFLHLKLNEALRKQDINFLYYAQHFIRLLHERLVELHAQQKQVLLNGGTTILKVYRGVSVPDADFEQIKRKVHGDFLSINSFLSTTTDTDTAIAFARRTPNQAAMTRLLFKIEVDVAQCRTAFANIQEESVHSYEKEILFTMGCVFTIQSIVKDDDDDDLWIIHLKLTGKEDGQLLRLKAHVKRDILHLTPFFQLARLMEKKGEYEEADRFYNKLLREGDPLIVGNYEELAAIYNNRAACLSRKGQKEKAEELFKQAIQILSDGGGVNHSDLPQAYSSLAVVYKEQGDKAEQNDKDKLYNEAISLLKKAEVIVLTLKDEVIVLTLKDEVKHLRRLATIYNNLGFVYDAQNQYDQAFQMHWKALDICQRTLPPMHPDLAASYNNVAQLYQTKWDAYRHAYRQTADRSQQVEYHNRTMEYFNKTIEFFNKAHDIKLASLPSDHHDLALSYNNRAMAYYLSGQLEEGIAQMESAIAIYSKNLSLYTSKVAELQNWVVKVKQQQQRERSRTS